MAEKKSRRNRPSPRSRLLESATKLFKTEGIRVIGIDRILREADVAKASLYSLFGSKDALVIAPGLGTADGCHAGSGSEDLGLF